ncbi:hypothetical protein ACHQM5_000784 [Ranunculus cassubicifolius]
MEKSSCSIEVTIISAEDLRHNGRPVKKNTFVTIETDSNSTPLFTSTDTVGGSYPSWNEKLEFSFPYNGKNIRLDVKCKIGSSVKTIGSVFIPLSDFLEDYVPANCLHFLSYRLRDHDGDRNGIVNLSIRVEGAEYIAPTAFPSMKVQTGYNNSNACGWMAPSRNHRRDTYTSNNGGIAIGVPVSKGYW